jgi:1,4-dihydroxy-2-naphthoate octaprenyltransferase
MTLVSVTIAGLLALGSPLFDPLLFLLAALGSVVAHAANNMINDLFDLDAGLDAKDYPRSQYAPHPVLAGLVERRGLVRGILIANLIDAAIMLVLFAERGWPIIAFALAGLFISVFYVAPPLRLKSKGLGEVSVAVIWGPVMVGGTYYAAVGNLPVGVWLLSIPYALLVTSVLMGKHIDKAPWDRREGVKTLPVLLGDKAALNFTKALLIGFYVTIVALVATRFASPWLLVVLLALPSLKKTLGTYSRAKPDAPPERFPVWPLWYGPWAFVHSRRAGASFVLGLALMRVMPL